MKKILTFIIAAIALSLCGCSKDGDYNPKDIVGKWEAVKTVASYHGETETILYGEDAGRRTIFEFFEDGTLIATEMEYYLGSWHTYTDHLLYELKGNRLYILSGDAADLIIETLTSTQLVIKGTYGEENSTTYYNRVD